MTTTVPSNLGAVIDISRSFGLILIATVASTACWGVTCTQTLMYFETYKSDKWHLKTIVVVLWLLNTLHGILCIQVLWYASIPNFGNHSAVSIPPEELMGQVIVSGVVGFLAQSFFLWRVWRFSDRNWILLIVLIPPIVTQLVGVIAIAAFGFGKPLGFFAASSKTELLLINMSSSLVAIVDTGISIIMCILLWRGRTGLPSTDRMIFRLIHLAVSTGSCTALFALISLVTAAIWPDEVYYVLGQIPLCTLYCNAVLANINSRKYVRSVGAPVTYSPPSMLFDPLVPSSSRDYGQTTNDGQEERSGLNLKEDPSSIPLRRLNSSKVTENDRGKEGCNIAL